MSARTGVPSYRRHSSGQARVTLIDVETGRRKDVLLGTYGSRQSKEEYGRVLAQWEAMKRRIEEPVAQGLSVSELFAKFWDYARETYVDADGNPTTTIEGLAAAIRPCRELYGFTRAMEFGPLKLKAVRQRMIDSGLCRSLVNWRTNAVRRIFKWGVANELVPPSVLQGLQAVEGLRIGRGVREAEPVGPVSPATVEETMPHLPTPVAAIVQLMLLTGARAGEIAIMRACDLDVSGRIWIYRPYRHKTAHRGKRREIYIGPKAQAMLKPWLPIDTQAFLFSPAAAEMERNAERSRDRQTPRYPSHLARNERKRVGERRRRKPGERYTTEVIRRAIARACDLAFPLPDGADAKAWRKAHRWHPHQLRHTAATLLRKEHGIELARIILGHSSAFTTEIYAEADREQALEVIGRIG